MQHLGGKGPKLLILHATGFLGAAYQPLAAVLAADYDVYTIDFPGHGVSSRKLLDVTALAAAEYLVETVDAHGLRGCVALGHSAGGAFSLLASTMSPGLFAAVYCFEAVVSTPQTHNFMAQSKQSGLLRTAGQLLSSMARRRRSNFNSRDDALQRLMQKPPFAGMQPESVKLFVQHGLKQVQPADTADATQQQQPGRIELVCDPGTEALYYEALDPPPAVLGRLITCPVMLATAASTGSGAYQQHDAVRQWLLQNPPDTGSPAAQGTQSSSSSAGLDPLHGVLAVLNEELAAAIPAEHVMIPGVSHFGPLEKPEVIAASCSTFFQKALAAAETRQQQFDVSNRRSKL